jgi:hypothetical protein
VRATHRGEPGRKSRVAYSLQDDRAIDKLDLNGCESSGMDQRTVASQCRKRIKPSSGGAKNEDRQHPQHYFHYYVPTVSAKI